MSFSGWDRAYFEKQSARIERSTSAILGKETPLLPGRVIPDSNDLVIGTGRRLDASIMFLDICQFSARAGETEIEQLYLLRIITLFFNEVIRIIEDHDGTVEKNTGDGLMAYFVAKDGVSAQQKAVATALTIFATVNVFINPQIVSGGGERVDFRICIDHGPITVAHVGVSKGFHGIVAIGTRANVAAKMLDIADNNELLIGEDVRSGLPNEWALQFTTKRLEDSGWSRRSNGSSYALYTYHGRWSKLV